MELSLVKRVAYVVNTIILLIVLGLMSFLHLYILDF